jgi:hypothetical protein
MRSNSTRQPSDFIAALEVQPRRQVLAAADRHCMTRHVRQRHEHHAIEHQQQQQQHDDGSGEQADRCVGNGGVAALRDTPRHVDTQGRERLPIDIVHGAEDLGELRGLYQLPRLAVPGDTGGRGGRDAAVSRGGSAGSARWPW